MSRMRGIKPDFFVSLENHELTAWQRLLWIGLWTHCDDAGRCIDDARLIQAAVMPLDRSVASVERDLDALAKHDRIIRYRADVPLVQITNWRRHQFIQKPKPSKYPPPAGYDAAGFRDEDRQRP